MSRTRPFRARASTVAELGDPAGARDTDHFALEVAKFGDAFSADKNLIDVGGVAADNDDIGAAVNTCDCGNTCDDGKIGIAAHQSRHDDRTTPDVHRPDVKSFGGKQPEFLSHANRQ